MSTFEIEIQLDVDLPEPIVSSVQEAVKVALHHQAVAPPAAVTLLLTGNQQLRRLNRDFRHIDKPTDVLSFPAGEPIPGLEDAFPYLGDIAIAVPQAGEQASASGHSLQAELQLLAVHGVLHLLGYDHLTADEKEAMWAAQAAILAHMGLHNIVPTEDDHAE